MQPSPVGEATSSLVGMGIRFAQEVGAHKRHPPGKTPQEKAERELWKRAYWVLVSLDFFSSSSTGRPRATTEKECVFYRYFAHPVYAVSITFAALNLNF